nr:hypothetical protein [Tanacetum cinerariifolium]
MRGLHSVIDGAEQQAWQKQLRQAVNDFDERCLDQLYGQIFSTYPLPVVFEDVVMPVWPRAAHAKYGATARLAGRHAGRVPRAGVVGGRRLDDHTADSGQCAGTGTAAGRIESGLRKNEARRAGAVLHSG